MKDLVKHDAEFLILGLAYHIMRTQDSVRLKKKILMKNSSQIESSKPGEGEAEEESNNAAKLGDGRGDSTAGKPEQLLIGEA